MTAFQAGQIVQEYIRGALPLFEPMEQERNGGMCEETFEVLYNNGAFGSRSTSCRGRCATPTSTSLREPAARRDRAAEGHQVPRVQADRGRGDRARSIGLAHPGREGILRDVANGIRVPAKWLRTEEQVDRRRGRPQLRAAPAAAAPRQPRAELAGEPRTSRTAPHARGLAASRGPSSLSMRCHGDRPRRRAGRLAQPAAPAQAIAEHAPWKPAPFEPADAAALPGAAAGNATARSRSARSTGS
jgi:hypothetical protein